MIKTAARRTVRLSNIFIGVFLILLALFTVIARIGLPLLDNHKSNIEARVSDYLKSPVEIGELSVRWEGAGPRLQASRVVVFETDERKVALDELLIDINLPKSLLRGIPIINELSLIGARLAIEANAAGQLKLHGMEAISGEPNAVDVIPQATDSKGVDVISWLFNARKVGLLNTQLTLIDLKTDRRYVLESLNIRAENRGSTRQLRIDAQLPGALGGRVEAGIDLASQTRDLSRSSGNLYVAANALNVRALNTMLRVSGFLSAEQAEVLPVNTTASLEVWGEWKAGQLLSLRGPVLLDHIVERESGDVLFEQAEAHLGFTRDAGVMEFSIRNLRAAIDSRVLQIEELAARQSASDASAPLDTLGSDVADLTNTNNELARAEPRSAGWQFSALANELPADLTARLVRMVVKESRQSLNRLRWNLSAGGIVKELSLDMAGSVKQPLLNVSARFDDVEIRGDAPLPAIGPISGDIEIQDSLGQISLQAQQVPLIPNAQINTTLVLDSLEAAIDVDVRNPERLLMAADIQLADDGIETNTRLSATWTPGNSPHLDIQSSYKAADVTALKAWLPRKLIGPAATDWIDRAIVGGVATNGTLLFFGHVADFPFRDGEGVFRSSVDISEAELRFMPDWPSAKNISGSLELDGMTLTGIADESTLGKFAVSKARASIDNIMLPVLEFDVTADGGFQDIVEFGINGPLRGVLRPAIGDMSGTGAAQMDLKVIASLFKKPDGNADELYARTWQPFRVNGGLFLDRNDVTFGRAGLRMDDVSGAVGFNHLGININQLKGKVLGHSVRVTGKTLGRGDDANTSITIDGVMEANDLLAHYENPLDQFISGGSQWSATITAPHSEQRAILEGITLKVSSDLVGSTLLLPAPFDKGSSVSVPFSLQTAFRVDASDQLWDVQYGDKLSARVRLINNNLHAMLIELGERRRVDIDAALVPRGIRIQGNVQQLAADGWIGTLNQYLDSLPSGDGDPQLILPVSASLNTAALILGSQSLGKASLQANTDDIYLNFTVSNGSLKGNMRYPRKHWLKDTPLISRIGLLDWSVIDALGSASPDQFGRSSTVLDPRTLPPIQARVSTLVKDNIRVRDVVLRAQPNVSGIDITTLGFAYDTMRLVGKGQWHLLDPQNVNAVLEGKHQTTLDLVLQSSDFGRGLDEIGLTDIMDEAQGNITMNLRWPGPLYLPETANMSGRVGLNLENGSIIPFDPGAGRMMGLFAIQALPRRLNLDFRDVIDDGLAFSRIIGNAQITNGVANVPLLQLTGPIGVVDVIGTSDLNTQQFDQQVTVLPRISAALPIIGAISGGASAGISALVAAGFLKAMGIDFDRIGLRKYRLTGPWVEPAFTSIPSGFSR